MDLIGTSIRAKHLDQATKLSAESQAEAAKGRIATWQSQERERRCRLRTLWRGWLRFAEVLGTVQMMVILSLVFWVMLPVIAIPFKLFSDPLGLRRPDGAKWVECDPRSHTLEGMRQQY